MKKQEIVLSVILIVTGLAIWLGLGSLSNEAEAWDSIYYFQLGLPIMCTASAIAGFIVPERPWRWGLCVVLLQPLILFTQSEAGPLLFIGFLTFLPIAGLAIGSAYLGSMLRKYVTEKK